MTDGTNQGARLPAGLREPYFSVDELSFTDLLAMSERLAAQLLYPDLQNETAGSWDELFVTDESFVIASILSLDLQSLQSGFLRELPGTPVEKLAGDVVALAHKMDGWLKTLKVVEQHPARVISHRIEQLVSQSLGEQLHWIIARFGERTRPVNALARAARSLDDIWLVQRAGGALHSQRSERQLLRTCFFSFVGAILQLQSLAANELPRSLASRRHAPAIGLLMAFLQLFQVAQKRINRFTERHAEFYYLDCLRMRARAAQPDTVHLVCERDTRAALEVVVARGTQFSAGPDADGRPVVYCADDDLTLTDAKVAALYTLRREHDPSTSPERELGYVTRLKVDTLATAPVTSGDTMQAHWPLFGGTNGRTGSGTEHPAQIGLAIASPLLWLKEGAREIRLTLRVACRAGNADERREAIRKLCASSENTFFSRFGELFKLWLLAPEDWLGEDDLRDIRLAARGILGERDTAPAGGDPLSVLIGPNRPERELIFNRIFNAVFAISVTAPKGWHEVADTFFVRAQPGSDRTQGGVQIVMRLGPEDESLVPYAAAVHGHTFTTRLPVVRICLKEQARLYPYSLLEGLALREIAMTVEVSGARDVVLYNNLGRLDPSKPFIPFGPLPEPGSYLVLGSAEIACKPISALALNIEWGGLPQSAGGLREYYRDYESPLDNDVFKVTTAILRDGQWCPRSLNRREVSLFSTRNGSGRIDPTARLEVDAADLRNQFKASPEAVAAEQLQYGPAARNGFVRVQLTQPPGAFGHQEYPELLTRVVAANARRPGTHPIPNPPYTPVIERLTLDYQAQSTIYVGSEVNAGVDTTRVESVFHIHPLGAELVHPGTGDIPYSILPRFEHNGNLYIGLAARKLSGALTLLFHLREESASRQNASPPQINWSYLASNRWHRIDPRRVLFDTTGGFLTSGIVRLEIPAPINRLNTILSPELFWLRVSADSGFGSFAGLYGIRAQALRATRAKSAGTGAEQVLPAGSITEPVVSIPGLAAVVQIGCSFGGRGQEDRQQLWTRTSERLQHKNRACMPRDYERLVLDHFPDVFKVKCFPSLTTHEHAPSPGNVLIVVIPGGRTGAEFDSTLGRRLNAIELDRIAKFVRGIASPFAKVTVRNASYERIQVRCTVKLVRGADGGLSVRRLNREIVEFLSPWNDEGYQARFDWVIRREDIEARIRSLSYVEFVTGVSLLHIAEDDSDVFTLSDTARPAHTPSDVSYESDRMTAVPETDHVHPQSPWSIAIPTPWHIIVSVDASSYQMPQATGIGELSIGSTYIVGGAGND
jgi:hypothetical protein